MQPLALNTQSNFISGWDSVDYSLCDDLAEWARTSPDRGAGETQKGVNHRVKHSWDSSVNSNPGLLARYRDHLQTCVNLYIQQYPWCNNYSAFDPEFPIMLQHYPPGGGFKIWHTERVSKGFDSARHLVFMTYLTTVSEGGGTEFLHQNITVSAVSGRTIIWPADWTFTHRGIVAPNEEKIIVTGWLSFIR
jgi:hypothetical protein